MVHERFLAALASAFALCSVSLIWAARWNDASAVYVSQLGARNVPLAPLFNFALLLLATAAVLMNSVTGRRPHRYLVGWGIGATLLACGSCFGVAAVVPCSPGCPVPFSPTSTAQDAIHVAAAAAGFVLVLVAMLQTARSSAGRVARAGSVMCFALVCGTVITGAALSLLGVDTDLGGLMEYTATTLSVLWFAGLAAHAARSSA